MTVGVECAVGVVVQAARTDAIAVVLILAHLAYLVTLVVDNLLDELPLVVILILRTPSKMTTKVAILSLGNKLPQAIIALGVIYPFVLTVRCGLPLLDRKCFAMLLC